MRTKGKTRKELTEELETLRERLNEAEETLRAIHCGEVDALVVTGQAGEQVFTLTGAEHAYRELVETMNEGAATLSPDGTVLYCNDRLAEMLKVPLEKILGNSMGGFVHPSDRSVFDALLKQGLRDRSKGDLTMTTGDGGTLRVQVSARTLRLDNMQAACLVLTDDLTEQKRNGAALAEGRLSNLILEQAGDAIIVCDGHGRIVRASRTARQLCDVNPLFRPFDETFHLDDKGRTVSILSVLSGEALRDLEVTWERENGGLSTFLLNARQLSDAEGKVLGCVVTLADITNRRKAEEALHRAHGELETLVQKRTADLLTTNEMLQQEVDERRRAEDGLRESKRLIQQIADAAPNIIFLFDLKEKKMTYLNNQITRYLGFTPEECCAMGSSVLERIHPEDTDIVADYFQKLSVAADDEIHSVEHRTQKKNGEWTWLRSRGLVFSRDEKGAPSLHLGTSEDITAEKEAEKVLQARARQHAALSDLSTRALIGRDMSLLMNEAAALISQALDVKCVGIMELQPDGESLLLRAGVGWKKNRVGRATLATGTGSHAGYTLDCAAPVIVEEMSKEERFTPSPLILEHGVVSGISTVFAGKEQPFGIVAAYTRQKRLFTEDEVRFLQAAANVLAQAVERDRTQKALEVSEAKFRTLVEKIPAVFYVASLDETGSPLYVSPQIEYFLGYPLEEYVNAPRSWLDKVHPEDKARALNKLQKSRGGGGPFVSEYRMLARNGRVVWVRDEASPVYDEKGRPLFVQGLLFDITESRQAEEDRLRLMTAIEQAHEGIVVTDRNGSIQYANPAFERISGLERADIWGGKLDEIGSCEGHEKFYERPTVWSGHLRRKREDGTMVELEATISPVRDPSGAIINYVIVERDVTEEIRLEQHLRQLQKMDALGALAGGIAHDFNNILQPIIINTELINYEAEEGSLTQQYLSHVLTAANRGKELVKQILMFSRTTGPEQNPMLVGPIVKEVLKFLRASLPRTIEIRREIVSEKATVMADPTSIHQVLMNLCSNAAHAMREKGGVLEVCLEEVEIDPRSPAPHPELKPGSYVRLTVADSGCGMDSATMQRIFEPFFTTKKPGEGTGMGLTMVHGIVKKLRGAILVSSEPGKGTTVHVFLPRVPGELPKEETSESSIPAGKERILLVDDEVAIVQSEQTMLERLGYRVVGKTDGLEALEKFRERPDAFDLVITDQTMHPITGMDLAQKILSIRPDVPIILCTGYSEAVGKEKVKKAGIRELVMKPLTSRDVAKIVRRVLDNRAEKTPQVNEE